MSSRNAIFAAIILVAFILVLVGTGAAPVLITLVVNIGDAIGAFVQSLIRR